MFGKNFFGLLNSNWKERQTVQKLLDIMKHQPPTNKTHKYTNQVGYMEKSSVTLSKVLFRPLPVQTIEYYTYACKSHIYIVTEVNVFLRIVLVIAVIVL